MMIVRVVIANCPVGGSNRIALFGGAENRRDFHPFPQMGFAMGGENGRGENDAGANPRPTIRLFAEDQIPKQSGDN